MINFVFLGNFVLYFLLSVVSLHGLHEGRKGRSQGGPKGPKQARRVANYIFENKFMVELIWEDEESWFWPVDISIWLLQLPWRLASKFIKTFPKAATCWFFININLFDHCLHWSHVAHIIIHRHMEQGSLKTTLNWMLYDDKMFLLHSIVIPLLSPLPLSIIHTGWWRRGLETTTTLTPVAPSSLCDA